MTRLVIRIALFALLLAGCAEVPVIVAPDAGDAGSAPPPVDAWVAPPDSGPPPEPVPGGECDQQDACESCLNCAIAPRQSCNARARACSDDAECRALWECINACGDEGPCLTGCGEAHPSGRASFLALYECATCGACPADCRTLYPTWCVEPPF